MGSIQTKQLKDGSTTFYAVYRVNGKQKWERVPDDYPGKRGAQRFLAEREAAVSPTRRMYFHEAARTWLRFKEPSVKRTTYTAYEQAVRLHLLPTLGGQMLAEIKPAQVQQLILDLHKDGLSVRYLQQTVILVLRGILDMAVQHEALHRNPAKIRITWPREEPRKKPLALTPQQVTALLDHCDPDWWGVYVTALFSGMRAGEILAMKWEYLSLEDRRYYVHETLTQDRRFTSPKNASSAAPVPLSPYLCTVLADQRSVVARQQIAARQWQDNDLIWPGHKGQPRLYQTCSRAFRAARKAAGLPTEVTVHTLRHTCASLLIREGADVKTVQEQLRHANPTITLSTYAHLYPECQDEAIARIDRVMGVG